MEECYGREDVKSELLPNNDDYRSLVGSLLYISVNARPDIAAATAILGRKVNHPTEADWVAAKRVIRYLRGTIDRKLVFDGSPLVLTGYSDADWAGNHASRKSTSGFVFMMGGAAISWRSRQQSIVALSSMESEYVSLSEAAQETVWLRRLLTDLGLSQKQPTTLYEDNQSCIAFVRSERVNKRSKHIETKEAFVKDLCAKGVIRLQYLCTEDMLADSLTKPLGANKIAKFSEMMGLVSG
ncbi:uncharacterized protein LOC129742083 [Uranotaenia lowii]|uniref:uncharacterized protein LOC129742083 n=1 Tax=Uranotaenia lowii TaxID=190385 RepID=UPI002478BB5B|nr:uncharacterized protein LOC129742083 [Uranotaenia lowii]